MERIGHNGHVARHLHATLLNCGGEHKDQLKAPGRGKERRCSLNEVSSGKPLAHSAHKAAQILVS